MHIEPIDTLVGVSRWRTLVRGRAGSDQGQATITLVGVIALTIALGLGLVAIAQAMVHRAHARNAADAVALASVIDADAAESLSGWYLEQGIAVEFSEGHAHALSGPSQAAAYAGITERETTRPAPVIRAIVARAEQLVGTSFLSPRLRGMRIEVGEADAPLLNSVAADLGLCPVIDPGLPVGWEAFEVC